MPKSAWDVPLDGSSANVDASLPIAFRQAQVSISKKNECAKIMGIGGARGESYS